MADLTEQEREVLARFRSLIAARFGSRVRDLRLFGSRARGDWEPDSDYDVLVVLDAVDASERAWIIETAVDLLDTGLYISPRIFDEAHWSHLRQRERRIVRDVEDEGMPL